MGRAPLCSVCSPPQARCFLLCLFHIAELLRSLAQGFLRIPLQALPHLHQAYAALGLGLARMQHSVLVEEWSCDHVAARLKK